MAYPPAISRAGALPSAHQEKALEDLHGAARVSSSHPVGWYSRGIASCRGFCGIIFFCWSRPECHELSSSCTWTTNKLLKKSLSLHEGLIEQVMAGGEARAAGAGARAHAVRFRPGPSGTTGSFLRGVDATAAGFAAIAPPAGRDVRRSCDMGLRTRWGTNLQAGEPCTSSGAAPT